MASAIRLICFSVRVRGASFAQKEEEHKTLNLYAQRIDCPSHKNLHAHVLFRFIFRYLFYGAFSLVCKMVLLPIQLS